jgi:hypothetical protein
MECPKIAGEWRWQSRLPDNMLTSRAPDRRYPSRRIHNERIAGGTGVKPGAVRLRRIPRTTCISPLHSLLLGGITDKPSREVWLAGSIFGISRNCPASNVVPSKRKVLELELVSATRPEFGDSAPRRV